MVVTRPVAKLNIEWPVERECQDRPKNKQAIAFHQLSPTGASSFKTPVLPPSLYGLLRLWWVKRTRRQARMEVVCTLCYLSGGYAKRNV